MWTRNSRSATCRSASRITQKAKALLAQAGHAQGLTVTLTTENLLEMPQYAVAIKAYCAPAGINVNLNIMPSRPGTMGRVPTSPGSWCRSAMTDWAARGTVELRPSSPSFPCGAAWNSAHWCDQEFRQAPLPSYNAELDHQKRQKLALQLADDPERGAAGRQSATGSRRAGRRRSRSTAWRLHPTTFIDLRGSLASP